METSDLTRLPHEGSHLLFSDTVSDNLKIVDITLRTCRFQGIGAKEARFEHCSLTQCHFEDSYLRKAHFQNVDFTGSTFRHCNLEKASFQGCNLRYCTFRETRLDHEEIIACLPVEPNLRRDLARSLRRNFEDLGDKAVADQFLNIEIAAHEKELLGVFRRKTSYYKTHYSGVDQAIAGFKFLGSKLSGLIWGYGHRVSRLLGSYFLFTLVFALITYFCSFQFCVDTLMSVRTLGFWESINYTFATTLGVGVGPITPASGVAKAFQLCESFIGTIFLALLAAAAYRRIAR